MKTNIAILLVSAVLSVYGCTQPRPAGLFTVKGHTIGIDTGTAVISYRDTSNQLISDTARIENSRFTFSGYIKQPTRTLVRICGRGQYLYFEPQEMTLTADTSQFFIRCTLTGSKTEEMNDKIAMIASSYVEYFREIGKQEKEIDEQLQTATGKVVRDSLQQIKKQLSVRRKELKNKVDLEQNRLLLDNPGFLTVVQFSRFDEWPVDSQKVIIARLPEAIRQYDAVKQIEKTFPLKANSLKGTTAANFKATDINGKPVNLSDFKGKTVLLDFWASWCGPCRMSIPSLNELYRKYHKTGFDIIAVSYDDNAEKWKQAIAEEKTEEWHHVLNVQEMGKSSPEDIRNLFYVTGLPTQLLVDTNGKIVGRWVGFDEANIDEIEQLLNERPE